MTATHYAAQYASYQILEDGAHFFKLTGEWCVRERANYMGAGYSKCRCISREIAEKLASAWNEGKTLADIVQLRTALNRAAVR